MIATKISKAKALACSALALMLTMALSPAAWAAQPAEPAQGATTEPALTATSVQQAAATDKAAAKAAATDKAAESVQATEPVQHVAAEEKAVATQQAAKATQAVPEKKAAQASQGTTDATQKTPTINARAHVQTYGWMEPLKSVQPDTIVGTQGKKKRVEGLRFAFSNKQGLSGSIQYRAYVQTYGWQDWVSDGATAGTVGKKKRVEAFEVRLTGQLAERYDVYYQAHVQKLGWLAWAKNGQPAGSSNLAYRMEALRIQLVPKGQQPPQSQASTAYQTPQLKTSAHVQRLGTVKTNHPYRVSTATIGTTGQKRQLEALSLAFDKKGVTYQVHVAKLGWMSAKSDGASAGTSGRRLAIQALKVNLNGELAQDYDVYYRTHVSKIGWMGWAKNGDVAGTTSCGLPVEAVQVKLVAKGNAAPGSTAVASLDGKALPATLKTTTATPGAKFATVANGAVAGTTGKKKALSAFGVQVAGADGISGTVRYQAHFAKKGWVSGSDGNVLQADGNRLQAIRVSLTGGFAKHFDVYYRAHVSGHGWMGWAKNGASAGTTGLGKNVEAVQVKLVSKGKAAPGSTARAFSDKNGFLAQPKLPPEQQAFVNRANGYASKTNWIILVDTRSNRVAVMSGRQGAWKINRVIPCTSGAYSSPTVKGTFTVTGKGYSFGSGYTCYYYTQFYGNYLFHSVLYNQGTFQLQDGRLGINASHGCVRLALDQAKWIYDNIPYGTKVVIY